MNPPAPSNLFAWEKEPDFYPDGWLSEIATFDGANYPRKNYFFPMKKRQAVVSRFMKNGQPSMCVSTLALNSEDRETALRYGPHAADLDGKEGELENVQREALEYIAALGEKTAVHYSELDISFSGCKGFHVLAAPTLYGAKPAINLDDIYRRISQELKDEKKFHFLDFCVYDRSRLLRPPNTIHPKTKLYKVPLTYAELDGLTIREIKETAACPRTVDVPTIETPTTKAAALFERHKTPQKTAGVLLAIQPTNGGPPDRELWAPLVNFICTTPLRDATGRYNVLAKNLAAYSHGLPPEERDRLRAAYCEAQKTPITQFPGWDSWAASGRLEFNGLEIFKFLHEKHGVNCREKFPQISAYLTWRGAL